MKKIALLMSLLLMFLLQGCRPSTNTCPFSGLTPNGTYLIIIPGNPFPTTVATRVASSTGTISVSTTYACNSLVAIAVTTSNLSLSASPSSVYLPAPPTTVTITGQSFDTTYGMPRVMYFDGNGFLVGSVYATSVSGGGTSLQADVPDLSNAYSGTYQVKVTNKTSQGYYTHTVGSATMTGWGRDRFDSDGDGWYDDEDCNPSDPYLNSDCGGNCGGGGLGPPYQLPTICEY